MFLVCRVFVGVGLAGVSAALAAVQNLGWGTGPIVGSVFAAACAAGTKKPAPVARP